MDHRSGNVGRTVRRWIGGTRDAGSASLDYVGMVTLAAGVILALLLAAPGVGPALVDGVRKALCTAFDVGCDAGGSAEATDELPPPEEPCETSSHSTTAELGVDVLFVKGGKSVTFTKVQTSDGQWHVTVADGCDIGLIAGAGAEGHVEFGDTEIGLGAVANASASLTGEFGQTWDFASDAGRDLPGRRRRGRSRGQRLGRCRRGRGGGQCD